MTFMRILKLFWWKYRNYRAYDWKLTLVEFLVPILLVFGVIATNQTLLISKSELLPQDVEPWIEHDLYLDLNDKYREIFYTPPIEGDDMQNLFSRLYEFFRGTNVTWTACATEKELVGRVSSAKDRSQLLQNVGIVFLLNDVNNYTLQPSMTYKIRDNNLWDLDSLHAQPETEESGPYVQNPYYTTGFSCLQSAIERAFLSLIYEGDPRRSVKSLSIRSRAFPYPGSEKSSKFKIYIPLILGVVIIISSILLCRSIIMNVISEKETGIKEWMKIAGAEEKYIWMSWFLNSLIFSVVIFTFVTCLIVTDTGVDSPALIGHVSPSVIWVIIMVFFMTQMAFCFIFCTISNSIGIATALFVTITLTTTIVAFQVHYFGINFTYILATCIFPAGALLHVFIRIGYYELLATPLNWETIFDSETTYAELSVGHLLLILVADTFFYLFLTYYINAIHPGRFGFKKPWYFLFFLGSRIYKYETSEDVGSTRAKDKVENEYVENVKDLVIVNLEIKDLQKKFEDSRAVNAINLSANKDEVLVLLGRNGAGKSTTLSMIAGLIMPSAGSITFKGHIDALKYQDVFRSSLGFCPQENRLFSYLSVIDHLIFFGSLKGKSLDEVEVEAAAYLKLMGMYGMEDEAISSLSAATKRKLCVCISLMGKAELLILDEPTAGIDETSRRVIWSLLQDLKRGRTIIVTSQNMKDAEKNGDRIAILNRGVIACHGSVSFLKKIFALPKSITS